MPRLSQTVEPEVEVSGSLSPRLELKVKEKLIELAKRKARIEAAQADYDKGKDEIELIVREAGEDDAIEKGIRIDTPLGTVPLKIVRGVTKGRLDLDRLMKKFKLTVKQVESCRGKDKDNKPYLGVWFPKAKP